ncbi:hypothetical protein V496_06507 [Pseudogymnoascus sp. VKM F-4515 (FW-2607)]|nr:hypothetical protein V496_06507 [Pseudogymnoascus sp. VKM F-4515 (FW-2607)]
MTTHALDLTVEHQNLSPKSRWPVRLPCGQDFGLDMNCSQRRTKRIERNDLMNRERTTGFRGKQRPTRDSKRKEQTIT